MSHASELREELKIKALHIKDAIDVAIDTNNPNHLDKNTIPDEHAVLVAKYTTTLAIDCAGEFLQLKRQSEAAGGIFIPRPPQEDVPDMGEIERLGVEEAEILALRMLKRVVDYNGWSEDMAAQLEYKERVRDRRETE